MCLESRNKTYKSEDLPAPKLKEVEQRLFVFKLIVICHNETQGSPVRPTTPIFSFPLTVNETLRSAGGVSKLYFIDTFTKEKAPLVGQLIGTETAGAITSDWSFGESSCVTVRFVEAMSVGCDVDGVSVDGARTFSDSSCENSIVRSTETIWLSTYEAKNANDESIIDNDATDFVHVDSFDNNYSNIIVH